MNRRQFLRRTASGLIITVTPTIFLPAREPLRVYDAVKYQRIRGSYITPSPEYDNVALLTDTTDWTFYVYGWREGQTPLITNGRLEA